MSHVCVCEKNIKKVEQLLSIGVAVAASSYFGHIACHILAL